MKPKTRTKVVLYAAFGAAAIYYSIKGYSGLDALFTDAMFAIGAGMLARAIYDLTPRTLVVVRKTK